MKIKNRHLLIAVSASFVLFTGGFFLGRNLVRPAVVSGRIAPPEITSFPSGVTVPEPVFPLDLNTATAGELEFLPGIGPAIAQRIVTYREESGSFQEITDLLNVNGIGPSTLEELLPYIEIGG